MNNFINAKWLFDWKTNEYGWQAKSNARLVARGDLKEITIDFR